MLTSTCPLLPILQWSALQEKTEATEHHLCVCVCVRVLVQKKDVRDWEEQNSSYAALAQDLLGLKCCSLSLPRHQQLPLVLLC